MTSPEQARLSAKSEKIEGDYGEVIKKKTVANFLNNSRTYKRIVNSTLEMRRLSLLMARTSQIGVQVEMMSPGTSCHRTETLGKASQSSTTTV